jgi:hypothetical protein
LEKIIRNFREGPGEDLPKGESNPDLREPDRKSGDPGIDRSPDSPSGFEDRAPDSSKIGENPENSAKQKTATRDNEDGKSNFTK